MEVLTRPGWTRSCAVAAVDHANTNPGGIARSRLPPTVLKRQTPGGPRGSSRQASSGRWNGAFDAIVAEGDIDEVAVGDFDPVVETVAAGPRFDCDGDRGAADPLDGGIDAQDIADLDGRDEGHGL